MLTSTAGDSLRHARWAKGLKIREAAEAAKTSTKTLVKVEKGKQIDGSIVYRLCEVYGIDPLPLFVDAPESQVGA